MIIEVLYPEVCNLYGDLANVSYIKDALDDVKIVETHLNDEPLFVRKSPGMKNAPDMVYMGTMTEDNQLLVIEKLSKYKEAIRSCIEDGMNFLITGNAVEVFGNKIIEDDVELAEGLGIIDIEARRQYTQRYNSLYVGDFAAENEVIKIVGFKSTFGFIYGNDLEKKLFDTVLGYADNLETKNEGVRVNNFIATYVIGPLMVLNPPFAKWYLKNRLGKDVEPAFYGPAMDAYNARVEEYCAPGKGWKY